MAFTVKQLKEFLEKVPNDCEVVIENTWKERLETMDAHYWDDENKRPIFGRVNNSKRICILQL